MLCASPKRRKRETGLRHVCRDVMIEQQSKEGKNYAQRIQSQRRPARN